MASPSPPPPTQPPPSLLFAAFQALVGGRAHREAVEEALRRRRATGEGYCTSCRNVCPRVNDHDTCASCAAPPPGDRVVWTCTAFIAERNATCDRAVTVNDVRSFSSTQVQIKECALCWEKNILSQQQLSQPSQ